MQVVKGSMERMRGSTLAHNLPARSEQLIVSAGHRTGLGTAYLVGRWRAATVFKARLFDFVLAVARLRKGQLAARCCSAWSGTNLGP